MTTLTPTAQPNRGAQRPNRVQQLLRNDVAGLLLLLVAIVLFFLIATPTARQARVYFDVLRQVSPNLIAAIGITILMIGAEFDLSIGSVVAAVSIVTITVFNLTDSMVLGILAGLLMGLLVGAINGVLVTRYKMSSLMTTLGMMFALRGLVYVYTDKTPIADENQFEPFLWLFQGSLGPIPVPLLVAVLLIVIFQIMLAQSEFGRRIYAIGGNVNAARVSGLPVQRIRFLLFIIAGLTTGIAGMLFTAQTGTGYFDSGLGFELMIITAVVLGGVSLTGGQGSLVGAALGVLILGMVGKGMRLMLIPTTAQLLVTGLVLILAVFLYEARKRLGRR